MNGVYFDTTTEKVYKLLPVLAEDPDACSEHLQAILLLAREQDEIKALLLPQTAPRADGVIEEVAVPLTSLFGLVLQFGAACYDCGKSTNGGLELPPQGERIKAQYLQAKIKAKIAEMTARKEE